MSQLSRLSSALPKVGYVVLPCILDQVIKHHLAKKLTPRNLFVTRFLIGGISLLVLAPTDFRLGTVLGYIFYRSLDGYFFGYKIEPKEKEKFNQVNFYKAIREGNLKQIQAWYQEDPMCLQISQYDAYGWAPIHQAVNYNRHEIVKFLLEKNPLLINEKIKNEEQWNLLHLAVEQDNLEIVEWLAQKKPKLMSEGTAQNYNPLSLAIFHGSMKVFPWLCTKLSIQESDWILLVCHGRLEMLQWVAQNQPSLITERRLKDLALSAALGCHKPILEWLHNKDPSLLKVVNFEGKTLLQIAQEHEDSSKKQQTVEWIQAQLKS